MVKVLVAVVAVVVIAAGGYFGFAFYTQHRVAGEIETAFEQIRAGGGKASHGKVSFDARSRTVGIADIAIESATQPPLSVTIASITAAGVGQPETGRFSADSIEATDVRIGISTPGATDGTVAYKIPSLVVKDYAGPAGVPPPSSSKTLIDAYRSALRQFAAVSATSVSAPSLAGTLNFGPAASGEFAYSGMVLKDIKGGKIAAMQVERANFTVDTQHAGKPDKMTGEIVNIASRDFDSAALAAILDSQKAGEDRYIRAYGKTTAGPYTVTSALGLRMRVDAITFDDVGLRPSKLKLPALLATLQAAKTAQPSPAQARDVIEGAAAIYEGMRIGTAEMRGLSAETPQGPFKLEAIRLNLEDGKVGEFAVEGLDTQSPTGPVKVGRFALKAVDIANFIRMAATFSDPAQRPSPDQFLQLFPLLAGAEVKAVAVPFKNTGKPLNIEFVNLDWGQFVGPIPSKLRLATKFSGPLDGSQYRVLQAAGMDKMAMDFDLGAAWDEPSRSLALDPGAIEISGLVKLSARISLVNVPRQLFTFNPIQAATTAAQIEAGAIELTLRDLGVIEIAVAEHARSHNVSRDAARQGLIQEIRDSAATAASTPDAQAAVEALVRVVETPGTALTLKLTPLGKVSVMQLFRTLQSNPLGVLPQFRIETSTPL
jgi:hypothetical protein